MTAQANPAAPPDLDVGQIVEAFESALCRCAEVSLADFLPSPEHSRCLEVLTELIRVDLEHRFNRGESCLVEEYVREFPELAGRSELLKQLAFEEYRLRRQLGQPVTRAEYERRLGIVVDWSEPGGGVSGTSQERVVAAAPVEASSVCRITPLRGLQLPAVGTDFMGFHLESELGQGAFGKVYLARQGELADRFVALKVSRDLAGESRNLAQLQHTNIVPIYSIHRERSLQAVCMPYFGPHTLADVLTQLQGRKSLPESGRDLISTLVSSKCATQPPASQPTAVPGAGTQQSGNGRSVAEPASAEAGVPGEVSPALRLLENMSYVQAVLWIGARLADGLAHAHERGILHRDLKPANVLLAADGQPMLLDFNLSQDLKQNATAAYIGGTLHYMAPEHLEAFKGGKHVVDERADIYSLGAILFELLTGQRFCAAKSGPLARLLDELIAERRKSPSALWSEKSRLAPGVEAIIRHCLEPDPARRYSTARSLQEDIDHQLQDQPLRHASEPLSGRLTKWWQRNRWVTSPVALALLAAAVLLLATAAWVLADRQSARRHERESTAERERQDREQAEQLEKLRQEARDTYLAFQGERRETQFLLNARFNDPNYLRRGLALGNAALARYHVFQNEDWPNQPLVEKLSDEQREQLDNGIGELLRTLEQTATILDRRDEAQRLRSQFAAVQVNDLQESIFQGREQFLAGRYYEALVILQKVTEGLKLAAVGKASESTALRDVSAGSADRVAVWHLLGHCHNALQHTKDAIACYTAAIELDEDNHWLYLARAEAYENQRSYAKAVADLDRVIALREQLQGAGFSNDLRDAFINRARVRQAQGNYLTALADLARAAQIGPPTTLIHLNRAVILETIGAMERNKQKTAGLVLYGWHLGLQHLASRLAQHERALGFRTGPTDALSCVVRAYVRFTVPSPSLIELIDSVEDLDRALQFNPRMREALHNKAHVLSELLGPREEQLAALAALGIPNAPGAATMVLAGRAAKQQRSLQALEVLETELRLYPEYIDARLGRGIYLARMGKRTEALLDAEECYKHIDRPIVVYQIACIYAQTARIDPKDRRQAFRMLTASLLLGFGFDLLETDDDLVPIRGDPLFQELLRLSRMLRGMAIKLPTTLPNTP